MSKKHDYKKAYWGLLILWLTAGALLLLFVYLVNRFPEWQMWVNRFAVLYIWSAPVVTGVVYRLKKKDKNTRQ